MALNWYVAKVKPRNERNVQTYLGQYQIDVYAPDMVVIKRGVQTIEPLFPGYVFIHTDPSSQQWPLACWARGVSYFLPDRLEPAPISDDLVEDIKLRVEQWNVGGWIGRFEPGERLRIVSGPLKDLDAVFRHHIPGRQRCQVMISLLGQTQSVQVGATDIQGFAGWQRFARLAKNQSILSNA